jgi:hypothetical protein
MARGKLFQALDAFTPDGYTTIKRGELVREGHPLLDTYQQMFREAVARFEHSDVEQATASPGERRGAKV